MKRPDASIVTANILCICANTIILVQHRRDGSSVLVLESALILASIIIIVRQLMRGQRGQ